MLRLQYIHSLKYIGPRTLGARMLLGPGAPGLTTNQELMWCFCWMVFMDGPNYTAWRRQDPRVTPLPGPTASLSCVHPSSFIGSLIHSSPIQALLGCSVYNCNNICSLQPLRPLLGDQEVGKQGILHDYQGKQMSVKTPGSTPTK